MKDLHFIIGGAPKCGTGTLFDWLNKMPGLEGSSPKETHFAYDKEHPLLAKQLNLHKNGPEAYANCWQNKNGKLFEASTHYLYNSFAKDWFAHNFPHLHAVFVLREPAMRIYSSFTYSQNNLAAFNTKLSFEKYIQTLQINPEAIAQYVDRPSSAFVLQNEILYSNYIDYIEQWQIALNPKQVHVVFFEELMRSPENVIKILLNNMGLASNFDNTLLTKVHRNETLTVKNQALHKSLIFLNKALRFLPGRKLMAQFYKSKNKKGNLPASDLETINNLKSNFVLPNKRLHQNLGLPLPQNWQY